VKTKKVVLFFLSASLFFPTNAYAEENNLENNVDTLPPPSQEIIEENPWLESSRSPEGQIPSGQDQPEIWAIVDEGGNTLNITVCDIDYCGSGWIPVAWDGLNPTEWARVVLQSQRNPENGKHNGGHWGQYNFSTDTWTQIDQSGAIYQVPVEYGSDPFCIQNCPILESETTNIDEEMVMIESNYENVYPVVERKFTLSPEFIKNKLVIKIKIKDQVFKNTATIVATKGKKKRVWNKKIRVNILSLKIPKKYSSWKISVKYNIL
jgi:hypothetical protein